MYLTICQNTIAVVRLTVPRRVDRIYKLIYES